MLLRHTLDILALVLGESAQFLGERAARWGVSTNHTPASLHEAKATGRHRGGKHQAPARNQR